MIPLVIKVLGTTNSLALQELDTVDRVYSCVCNAPICNPSTIPLAKISTMLSTNTNDHADPPIQTNQPKEFALCGLVVKYMIYDFQVFNYRTHNTV